jgi:hypothetical protein
MSTTLPDTVVTASRLPAGPAPVPRGAPRLSHKRIDVTFIKGTGTFSEDPSNTVKLSGLRASARIIKVGGLSMGQLDLRLWGMTPSKMNDLSTLGVKTEFGERRLLNNQIVVEAGDDDAGMSVVHHGTIYEAWVDFAGMPDVPFHVTAYTELWEAMKAVKPTGYRGMVDVATIMAGIASLAGWNFQNNGVNTKMEYPYYPGTAWEQMQMAASDAHINAVVDDGFPKTLVIWPMDGGRDDQVPLISPDTGMIGYPSYSLQGIIVTTRYNPSVGRAMQHVKIQSDLPQANGTWKIVTLAHTLDAEIPNGEWQTRFEAVPVNLTAPQPRASAP